MSRFGTERPFLVFHAGLLVNPDRSPNFKNIALIDSIYGGLEFASRRATVKPHLNPGSILTLSDNQRQSWDVGRMCTWALGTENLCRGETEGVPEFIQRTYSKIRAPFVIVPLGWKVHWRLIPDNHGSKVIELDMT